MESYAAKAMRVWRARTACWELVLLIYYTLGVGGGRYGLPEGFAHHLWR